jgi:hypothetical protein
MPKLAFVGAVAVAGFWIASASPVAQSTEAFNKSLEKFTIGDLTPKVSGSLAETSTAWKAAADSALKLASTRTRDLQAAIGPVKDQLDKAKDAAKSAEDRKDFTAAGAAKGQVKTGEIVRDLLERLQNIGSRQEDTAVAWGKTADMMRRFVEIDNDFDKYRGYGIARPGDGQKDTRLDSSGFQALKGHAEAMKDLGAALSQLGDKLTALGSDRVKFANDLEKGGHIQTLR